MTVHRITAAAVAGAAALTACADYGGAPPYGPTYHPRPGAPMPNPAGGIVLPGMYSGPAYLYNRVDRMPLASDRVVVFVGPHCRQCEQAVQAARTIASVPVEVLDVSVPFNAEQFSRLRVQGIPATVAKTQVLVGFAPHLMHNLLGGAGMRKQQLYEQP